jgi:hypothetical protein
MANVTGRTATTTAGISTTIRVVTFNDIIANANRYAVRWH